jgi:thiamine pyrophosphate-dependent acetolactate synthase large subunit-like protein
MLQMADMFRVFQPLRGDAVVIPGRGGRHWINISTNEKRDVPLGDPAMGGHASFALGMALARPEERIVLFDSEGDILMNLGALVTIAEKSPRNLYHFVLDNEVYATTGGQPVPNAQNVAYDIIAKGAGYRSTYTFDNLEDFSNNIEKILSEPGPVFVAMKVFPEIENEPINSRRRWRTRSTGQVVNDIKQELGVA